ncbi:MAG: hypothetical protein ACQEQV_01570 [Fibrobacterota bacterium]
MKNREKPFVDRVYWYHEYETSVVVDGGNSAAPAQQYKKRAGS